MTPDEVALLSEFDLWVSRGDDIMLSHYARCEWNVIASRTIAKTVEQCAKHKAKCPHRRIGA